MRTAKSLLEMCVDMVSGDVVSYSPEDLASLPSQLAEEVVKRVLARQRPPPLLHELLIFCQAFWRPSSLSLHNRLSLNPHSLHYLQYVPSLTKLDLSGNPWLDSLDFLPGLPKLNCLDVEDVYSLTDASASTFLPGITSLRSLNLSGTGISDGLLETLTYGQRLRSWMANEHVSRYAGANANSMGNFEDEHGLQLAGLMQQWRPSEIVYLRLQRTKITKVSLPYLSSFEQLLFLDVCDTEISGWSLKSLQAKHKLIALPNNSKMLSRWNSLSIAAFQGSCGCSSLGVSAPSVQETHREQPDWTTQYEQDGVARLLETASRLRLSASSQRWA